MALPRFERMSPEFAEELRPEAWPFALIPRGRFERVELCLRPNDQTGHLPTGAQAFLDAIDDVLPGTSLVGSVVMRREPLLQKRLLPLL